MAIIERKEKPPSYTNYQDFRKHLRTDFKYRCGYCTIHEQEPIEEDNYFTIAHLQRLFIIFGKGS